MRAIARGNKRNGHAPARRIAKSLKGGSESAKRARAGMDRLVHARSRSREGRGIACVRSGGSDAGVTRLELAVERAQAKTHAFGGIALVAVAAFEDAPDMLDFESANRLGEDHLFAGIDGD